MQSLLHLAFPPQCVGCHALVDQDFALCGTCWRQTPFISGLICDRCGAPLPGESPDHLVHCDDCMTHVPPWSRGRAALMYKDKGRALVLSLKHSDRLDLIRPAAKWMHAASGDLITPDTLLLPVPAHPLRMLQRRYNQAALLANALAKLTQADTIPDLLTRVRRTKVQDGMSREDRFANLAGSIIATRRSAARLAGRNVVLVDDVMTSGATLSAATRACFDAGAAQVDVLVLARVAKDT